MGSARNRSLSPGHRERWVLLTLGAVGIGLGLMLLAILLWWRQVGAPTQGHAVPAFTQMAPEDRAALAVAVQQLRLGRVPEESHGAWAPLWLALNTWHGQRTQAWQQYETQVSHAAPAAWLVPEQLVQIKGRGNLALRLQQLDQALQAWMQQEAAMQAAFDTAVNAWLLQAPAGLTTQTREQLALASGETNQTVHDYVQVEQALLAQIRHLSDHIASLGSKVALARSTAQPGGTPELVFTQEADLNRYQSSVNRLAELAEQEQAQMARVRQLDHQYMMHVAEVLHSVAMQGQVH